MRKIFLLAVFAISMFYLNIDLVLSDESSFCKGISDLIENQHGAYDLFGSMTNGDIIQNEGLPKQYIPDYHQSRNQQIDLCWQKDGCGDGCAVRLGKKLASYMSKLDEGSEQNRMKMSNFLKSIKVILKQFDQADFATALLLTYNTFINQLQKINLKITKDIDFSNYANIDGSDTTIEDTSIEAINRIDKLINEIDSRFSTKIHGIVYKDLGIVTDNNFLQIQKDVNDLLETRELFQKEIKALKTRLKENNKKHPQSKEKDSASESKEKAITGENSMVGKIGLILFILIFSALFLLIYVRIKKLSKKIDNKIGEHGGMEPAVIAGTIKSLELQMGGAKSKIEKIEDELKKIKDELKNDKEFDSDNGDKIPQETQNIKVSGERFKELMRNFTQRLNELEAQKEQKPSYLKQLNSDLKNIKLQITNIHTQIKEIQKQQEKKADNTSIQANTLRTIIKFENDILKKKWTDLDENLKIIAEKAKTDEDERAFYQTILKKIPMKIKDEELKKLALKYPEKIASLRVHNDKISMLHVINKRFKDKYIEDKYTQNDMTAINVHEEIEWIRKWTQFLSSFDDKREVDKITEFSPTKWIRESFIEIADYFLVQYQNTKPDDRSNTYEELHSIVVNILAKAGIEPISITPYKTMFNSEKHLSRSSTSNESLPDGVITGVIRSGFKQGERPIQTPEVTVNRK